MRLEYKPLPAIWPFGERTTLRVSSKFRAQYAATLDLLDRELWHLRAKAPVLEAGYERRDIRQDGQPKANALLNHPAIILSFDSRYGPLRYGCDRFDRHGDNLRAVALTLEAQRAMDRYGATRRGEQYVGWAQLTASAGIDTVDAEAFIWSHANGTDRGAGIRAAYTAAAKALFPQMPGDDRELWDRLMLAKAALGL